MPVLTSGLIGCHKENCVVENVKLYVSVASNRSWTGKFGSSLVGLFSYLSRVGIQTPGYVLQDMTFRSYGQCSVLPIAQEKFVDEMIAGGYTHWLSLDDDMTFPNNFVDRLIAHGKDVATTNYRHKTMNDINEVKGICCDIKGQRLDSTGKTGLEEVASMGGASFLARVDSFRNIPKPRFEIRWLEEKQDYVGSDVYFSTLLRINGVHMWCDHDLSQEIGHIGEYEYMFPQVKAEDKPKIMSDELQPVSLDELAA